MTSRRGKARSGGITIRSDPGTSLWQGQNCITAGRDESAWHDAGLAWVARVWASRSGMARREQAGGKAWAVGAAGQGGTRFMAWRVVSGGLTRRIPGATRVGEKSTTAVPT